MSVELRDVAELPRQQHEGNVVADKAIVAGNQDFHHDIILKC